jgi:hypothetical protein
MIYFDSIFQEDIEGPTLKMLRKNWRPKASNEKGSEKFVLQNEKVLA